MKLIVSDFDDTLYFPSYTNNDVLKQINAVNEWRDLGNLFVINTGRSFFNIKYMIDKYDFSFDYLICANGAAIYNEDLELIYTKTIDNDLRDEIIQVLKRDNRGNIILTANEDFESSTILNEPVAIYQKYNNYNTAVSIQEKISKYNDIDSYLSTNYICINHKDVNKSIAIKKLIEIENIKPNHIYTIGDSLNDIPMLKDYDGYKIGNKKVLDFVDKSYNSISKFINDIKKEG